MNYIYAEVLKIFLNSVYYSYKSHWTTVLEDNIMYQVHHCAILPK